MKHGTWAVYFELTLDGRSVKWENLTESAQTEILQAIADGYHSGNLYEADEDDDED